jgi:predicted hotdog family 3-hydroxylacyl-ACP dehydratase
MMQALPILSLIPQRAPFVMVDEFSYTDADHSFSLLKVREDNILVEDGRLSEGGLVENIAQTAAARIGYICQSEGQPVPIGYIGAVQDLDIYALPVVDDDIKTTITVEHQIFNVTQIRGTVMCREQLVAQCGMKIFISNQS